jgi:hypothetical protein
VSVARAVDLAGRLADERAREAAVIAALTSSTAGRLRCQDWDVRLPMVGEHPAFVLTIHQPPDREVHPAELEQRGTDTCTSTLAGSPDDPERSGRTLERPKSPHLGADQE